MIKRKNFKVILSFVFILCFLLSAITFAAKIKINDGFMGKDNLHNLHEIKLDGENRIYMDIGGAELYFDEDLEYIYIRRVEN